jgi:hypothetical protein
MSQRTWIPDIDPLIIFCRQLPGATEDTKWKKDLIFSVGDKIVCSFKGVPGTMFW